MIIRTSSRQLTVLVWLMYFGVTAFIHLPVLGQSSQATEVSNELRRAIERLDSSSSNEWEKSTTELTALLNSPTERELAIRALAMFHIRRGNVAAIGNLCRQMTKIFPQPSLGCELQMIRVQLWHALASEQPAIASACFSHLLKFSLSSDASNASNLASAEMLGAVVGMLEPDEAESPIDKAMLLSATNAMAESAQNDVTSTFRVRRERTCSMVKELVDWLRVNGRLSIEDATKVAEQDQAAVIAATDELKQINIDERNQKETIEDNIKRLSDDRSGFAKQVLNVQLRWKNAPVLHNLVAPDIRRIQVPTTEKVRDGWETERVAKTRKVATPGKPDEIREETYYEKERKPKYKTVHLSDAEILADKQRIYQQQLSWYLPLKAKRDELLDEKASLDAQIKDVNDSIKAAENELDTLKRNGNSRQELLKQLEIRSHAIEIALNALESGRSTSAFRPPSIEVIDFAAEERVLKE